MKKYFNLVVALVAMLFAGTSFAYTPPPAPANGWYVVDQTGKLSESDKKMLNDKIEHVSKTTKNEFGILLLNTMDGDNIEDVAYTTFNTWGVGKKGLDNGVLIVVSLAERKSRIETGKGVGGEVTDLQSKQILDNTLRPFLKKGDFAGGFNATLDALGSLIESRHSQASNNSAVQSSPVTSEPVSYPNTSAGCALAQAGVGAADGGSNLGLVMFLLGAVVAVVVWRVRAARRREREVARQAELEAQFEANQRRAREASRAREQRQREELDRQVQPVNVSAAPPVPTYQPPVVRQPAVVSLPPRPVPKPPVVKSAVTAAAAGVTAGALAAEAERRLKARQDEEAAARRRRDQEDSDRRRREEDDRRRRQREDDDRRSSSSSSSSYDFGSSSSGGGGYDGGSSGGGGASSDW